MYTLEDFRRFFKLNVQGGGSIILSFTHGTNTGPYYFSSSNGDQIANTSLTIGKWQHLAFTVKDSTLSIYIDAALKYNGPTTPVSFSNQLDIYFGTDGSRWTRAELDDIKIYNKSLTQTELVQSLWDKF